MGAEVALHETRQPRADRRADRRAGRSRRHVAFYGASPTSAFSLHPAPRPSRFFRPRLTPVVALALLPLVSVSAQGPHAPPRGVIATEGGHVSSIRRTVPRFTSRERQLLLPRILQRRRRGVYEHAWVEEVLDEASSLGLNVLRLWAFQDQWWEGERALQPAPGTYNDSSSSPSTVSSRERRRVASAFCSV